MQDLAEETISKAYSFITKRFKNRSEEFYQNIYDYLLDLFRYKKIDLEFEILNVRDPTIQKTLELMNKIVKIGLSTIGISQFFLDTLEKEFLKYNLLKPNETTRSYQDYFENVLKKYTKVVLILILIQYFYDIHIDWFDSIDSFDLFPRLFLPELNAIKKEYRFEEDLNSNELKAIFFINSKIIQKTIELVYEFNRKEPADVLSKTQISMEAKIQSEKSEDNIISNLAEVKSESISILSKKPIQPLNFTLSKNLKLGENYKKYIAGLMKQNENTNDTEELYHFDFLLFRHPPSIDHILNILNVNNANFIKAKQIYNKKFDIEELFHFTSILALLCIQNPFEDNEISEILESNLNEGFFKTGREKLPSPQEIFYGLSIVNILGLKELLDRVDFNAINTVLQECLTTKDILNFSHMYYSILSMAQIPNSNYNLFDAINTNLEKSDNFFQFRKDVVNIDNIFYKLSVYKILNRFKDIKKKESLYLEITEKFLGKYPNEMNLSQMAKVLLCTNLLQETEKNVSVFEDVFTHLKESVYFFDIKKSQNLFNWQQDKVAFKIELRMLYWILLALIFTYPKN